MTTSTYTVTGMTCQHCVGAVREELGRLPGVSDVTVDLDSGQVTVTSTDPLSTDDVRAMVDEAGYALAS
ncbi:cation-transporting ATPase [Actinophytocola xinjiangensis]|uniref:Cation-transporting ATPase n=1 Tax=Actinophytocola xinjiangensis TaxID=485602 RepID=A0A7Z1AV91_9PSEU|nr:heavy metal-associated domain-containing protein [Actinophytocola xinjiangensis]OLF06123.1 cation-transporting ATPase [Actinophytocola xinjiangensis]